jgi:hypothetical protein
MTTAMTAAEQAHALRAAARFIEDAQMPHLTISVHGDGTISIHVGQDAGPAAARIAAVAVLAAATGAGGAARTTYPTWSAVHSAGTGWIDGHDVRIGTYIGTHEEDEHA